MSLFIGSLIYCLVIFVLVYFFIKEHIQKINKLKLFGVFILSVLIEIILEYIQFKYKNIIITSLIKSFRLSIVIFIVVHFKNIVDHGKKAKNIMLFYQYVLSFITMFVLMYIFEMYNLF